MKIPDESIREFVHIYEKEFGEKLTEAQASEMAFRVLTLYEFLAKTLPNELQSRPPDDSPQV